MVKERMLSGNLYSFFEESKVFLDSVIENIPDMIFVKDAKDLRFLRFNQAGERLIGYSRNEMIGKSDYDFFPKEQADFFTAKDREVLASGRVEDIPEEFLNSKKGLRVLHTKKIPILDEHGEPKYLLGISEDITERKEAEKQSLKLVEERAARKEAERSAQRFAFLSETSKALSSLTNSQDILNEFAKIISKNLADWCLIEVIGGSDEPNSLVLSHGHPNKQKFVEQLKKKHVKDGKICEHISKVIKTGEAEFYNKVSDDLLRKVAPDNESFRILKQMGMKSAMIVPLKRFNRVLGAVLLVISESERRYTRMDLTMAQDIAERASLVVENAQLLESAQEANQAKTAFLATMSHEVRTPLGAIIGFTELVLESKTLQPEQQGFLKTILRNGKELLKIVDEILDISKVESDRLVVEQIDFSLPDLINDVTSLLKHKAEEKNIQFNIWKEPELPEFVNSDPTRLRQILINVIGNAIKFTEKGHVSLSLRTLSDPMDSGRISLEAIVSDSGIGISKEQMKNLFRPFSQAEGSTTRKFGGTGLGLYLSKKLAQALGGDLILAQSKVGVGSTFILRVSTRIAEKGTKHRPEEILWHGEKAMAERKLNVLVVDDSEDNRALMGMFISNMGHNVDFAENGIDGVEKAIENNYDVVLMDIEMPQLDGFQAVIQLRARNYTRPIVALTAHAMKGDRERCLREGFDDYLAKPICRDSLGSMLKRVEENHLH